MELRGHPQLPTLWKVCRDSFSEASKVNGSKWVRAGEKVLGRKKSIEQEGRRGISLQRDPN